MSNFVNRGRGVRLSLVLSVVAGASSLALGQAVSITSPTTIGPTDTTVAGVPIATAEITVQGTTLTINGRHTIKSLSLIRNGGTAAIVTHGAGFTFDYSGGAGTDVVSGMSLTIDGPLSIQGSAGGVASAIDVSGRGFAPGTGPGAGTASTNGSIGGAGGGHAGRGADAFNGAVFFAGGLTYGSITNPATFGSGGGAYVGSPGTAGGGCVRITVNGSTTLDGSILSDGGSTGGSPAGAGAGGSIQLVTTSLSGAGAVRANGGSSPWGGGAGGRVSVVWTTSTFTGTFFAAGGTSGSSLLPGGAGTVALRATGTGTTDLILDNAKTVVSSATPITGFEEASTVTVRNGANAQGLDTDKLIPRMTITDKGNLNLRGGQVIISGPLTLGTGAPGITTTAGAPAYLNVLSSMSVDASAVINMNGLGFAPNSGPGAGGDSNSGGIGAAGAAHGGNGGDANPFLGGIAYGSIFQPTTLGSGGGKFVSTIGGAGGGALRLDVFGTLTHNGTITANGVSASNAAGSGAGGSVWITASTFEGNGSVTANGGNNNASWGAAGGGRIAVHANANSYTGTYSASAGISLSAGRSGGAGTIFTKLNAQPTGDLIVDGVATANLALTPITGSPSFKSVTARRFGRLSAQSPITTGSALVDQKGQLELRADPFTVTGSLTVVGAGSFVTGVPAVASTLQVNGSATVDTGAAIDFNGLGFAANTGPGKGTSSNNGGIGAAGAGHAGFGIAAQAFPGGTPYGNIATPTDLGSGGGNFVSGPGGPGGGALKLTVGNTLTVNGQVMANGFGGASAAGSGSGGSLWITTGTLAGNGSISVNGQNGVGNWGGSSAGRMAVYFNTNSFTGGLLATGGTASGQRAAAGTIYLKQGAANPDLIVDGGNVGPRSLLTPITGVTNARSLIVRALGNAQWAEAANIGNATVQTGSRLELGAGVFNVTGSLLITDLNSLLTGQTLIGTRVFAQNVTVNSGASVSWSGLGYQRNDGPGAGTASNNSGIGAAGGGYGGRGANAGPFPGGEPYGDAPNPFDFGSGGGDYVGNPGGSGGGFLFMDVPGVLTINGALRCDGLNGVSAAGAGAGGSIYIRAGGLTGSGAISANGGQGNGWGSGGGGRIAIYACGNSFSPANITTNRGTSAAGATDGSIVFGTNSISFSVNPTSQNFSYSQIVTLEANANSTQPGGVISYQWRRRGPGGVFIPIPEGDQGRIFDTQTNQLTINLATCSDANAYDCLAIDSCGSFPSAVATLNITRRIGDFDMSGGTPDSTDIEAFFIAWLTGDASADVDDSGGTPDVTDISVFFEAWLQGC
jgi:hypothetical protein